MGILMDVLTALLITFLIFLIIIILILILPVFYDINFKSDCETATLMGKIDILFGIISIRIINNNKQIILFWKIKINLSSYDYDSEDIEDSKQEEANKSKLRRFKIAVYKLEAKCKESAYKLKKTVKSATDYKFKIDLIKKAVEYIQKVISIVKPKHSSVNITFGTGNAALNGKLMGAFAIFSAKYTNVKVRSDFEKKVLLIDVDAEGRMTLIRLLIIGINFLCEKPIKELRRMRKKGGKHGKKRRGNN